MSLFWILVVMPLAALLYFGWVVAWQKPIPYAISLAPASPARNSGWWKLLQRGRTIKWISSTELKTMTRPFEDVMVVDLFSCDSSKSRLLGDADFLHIKSDEFCDVLRWLPASSCVVLIGPTDRCRSMIKSASRIAGHAPIFVVAEGVGA
jgi:hypothetical protein